MSSQASPASKRDAADERRGAKPRGRQVRRAPADPFGYDPATLELVRPLMRFFYRRYWRVQTKGIENLPTHGPALIVANHSGGIPIDAAMLTAATQFEMSPPRLLRFLFDRFVSEMPLIGDFYRKVGSAPASYENGLTLLRRGDFVGLFPEGVAGVAKGFSRRYRLQEFRSGFVRLSIEGRAPIIPTAVVGAEEAYPVIGKWSRLGPLRQLLNVPYVPLTPLFPWFGALGVLPLPSRWEIRFGKPIRLYEDLQYLHVSPRTAKLLARDVRRQVQTMLHELLAERDGLFLARQAEAPESKPPRRAKRSVGQTT